MLSRQIYRPRGRVRRLALLLDILSWSLFPFAFCFFVDFTGNLRGAVPIVLFVFWPVRLWWRQVFRWGHYLRTFGWPGMRPCIQMLAVDELLNDGISMAKRTGVLIVVGVFLVALALITGLTFPLAGGTYALIFAVVAATRRSRPRILLLGASSTDTIELKVKLRSFTGNRFDIATLLRTSAESQTSPDSEVSRVVARLSEYRFDFATILRGGSPHPETSPRSGFYRLIARLSDYRSPEDMWKKVVSSLLRVSPLVVVDLRRDTAPVQFEVLEATLVVPSDRLLLVGPPALEDPQPRGQWISELDLLFILYLVTFPHRIDDPEFSEESRGRATRILRLKAPFAK